MNLLPHQDLRLIATSDPERGTPDPRERGVIRISGIGPVNTLTWTVIDGLRRIGEVLGLGQL